VLEKRGGFGISCRGRQSKKNRSAATTLKDFCRGKLQKGIRNPWGCGKVPKQRSKGLEGERGKERVTRRQGGKSSGANSTG